MVSPLQVFSRNLRAPFHRWQAFRLLRALHAARPSLPELAKRGQKLGSNGWYRVRTLQIPSEITALAREVEKLKPRIVVEIGTARGGTALIWAYLARERLITCDILDKRGFADLLRAFPPPDSACRVSVMIGDSHDPAFAERLRAELAGELADFLFIDGDHTEAGVARDFEMYREFVRPGGLIGFHDIAEKQPLPTNQVQHFWKKIRGAYETIEFIQNRDQTGFGIGVVRVPAEGFPPATR